MVRGAGVHRNGYALVHECERCDRTRAQVRTMGLNALEERICWEEV